VSLTHFLASVLSSALRGSYEKEREGLPRITLGNTWRGTTFKRYSAEQAEARKPERALALSVFSLVALERKGVMIGCT
jgi:hypothetical protein